MTTSAPVLPSVTLDRPWLRAWVNPAQFRARSLDDTRRRFSAHPGGLLTVPDFLDVRLARRLARFLLLEARFRTIYGLCEARGSASRQAWLAASNDERWYRLREYAGPRRPFRDSVGARTFQELVTALADPRFVSFVEVLTGLRLGAAELRVHGLRARDMLRPHSDRWGARRLTFLLYLTPGWREEFGGRFVLLGPGPLRTEVLPAFNSLVVFDIGADTRHFVTPVTSAAASRLRVSVGGWIDARDGEA